MTINVNPMAFNDWVTQIGLLVPVTTTIVDQVNTFTDPDLNTAIPQILNYAELRIQRDLSLLPAETSNTYTYMVDWRRAELLNSSRWSGTIGGMAERSTTTSHLALPLLIHLLFACTA